MDDRSAIARDLGKSDAKKDLAHMLASLVAGSQEFIGLADLEGRALFVNEAGRKLVGLKDLDAVYSTKIIDYFADDDQRKVREEVLPTVRDTEFWQGELKFRNFESGQLIPVLYNIFPVRDLSGTISAYGTVTRNLTESKHAEQQLRMLASIVESSDDAIVGKNLDSIVTSWNNGAERIFGYMAEEMVGQSITIVIPEDRHNEESEILRRIKKGEHIDHFETVRQRKDGRLITVSLTISPVKNAAGEIIGASKIARDITEHKRSQEQIVTLAREVEHRSNNLLASVQAIVDLSDAETLEGLKEAIKGRIQALANINSLFVEARWIGANLTAVASQELCPYSKGNEKRVRISGPEIVLKPNVAQNISLTLHELATNAAKYGALREATGRVDLEWQQNTDGWLILRWKESGGPVVRKPTGQGFGSRVIKQLTGQLHGEARFDWNPEGLFCEITIRV